MATVLLKTTTVLKLKNQGDSNVSFHQEKDEGDVRYRHLWMRRDIWEDLGEPQEITVTIEPGDKLNA